MQIRQARSLWVSAILLAASIGVQAKTIYVSPSGNDQNPGSSASAPLRTIAAASLRATAGDTVYLLAGQYNEAIVPASSGTGSGNSNRLPVRDSLYFSDGNGVLPGDTIQLQGAPQKATVVAIDRVANILSLSVPLAFSNGQGVALTYSGVAPDVGAPIGDSDARRPLPPSGVIVRRP